MSLAESLTSAIKAVCPIEGISVARRDDRSTWRIDFAATATAEQRAAAAAVVAGFDLNAVQLQDSQAQQRRSTDTQELSDARVDAAVLALLDMTPTQRMQWARTNFPTLTLAEQNRMGMLMNMAAVSMRALVR